MSYGSDYLREAMTLNERKVNNKKSLKESIEDKQPLKEENNFDYDRFKSDIYNSLADVMFSYSNANPSISDVERAIEWFLTHFFEVEDYNENLDNQIEL